MFDGTVVVEGSEGWIVYAGVCIVQDVRRLSLELWYVALTGFRVDSAQWKVIWGDRSRRIL